MDDENSENIATLAKRITECHQSAIQLDKNCMEKGKAAIKAAIDCGLALMDAKEQMKHGQWLPWLKKNCPTIQEREARRYMQLSKSADSADLSKAETLNQAYKLIGDDDKSNSQTKAAKPELDELEKKAKIIKSLVNWISSKSDENMLKKISSIIQPITDWQSEFNERMAKKEAALHDGFDDNVVVLVPEKRKAA